jgi:hypothetical protein
VAKRQPDDSSRASNETLSYQSIQHAPPRRRVRAVITGAAGVISLCIGGGLGVGAVAAAYSGEGIPAMVSAFLSLLFLINAWILLRQANQLWGWVG